MAVKKPTATHAPAPQASTVTYIGPTHIIVPHFTQALNDPLLPVTIHGQSQTLARWIHNTNKTTSRAARDHPAHVHLQHLNVCFLNRETLGMCCQEPHAVGKEGVKLSVFQHDDGQAAQQLRQGGCQ